MRYLKRIYKSKHGSSLIEVLVAMLLLSSVLIMLSMGFIRFVSSMNFGSSYILWQHAFSRLNEVELENWTSRASAGNTPDSAYFIRDELVIDSITVYQLHTFYKSERITIEFIKQQ